ncbi:MAG: hypothetical protein GXY48_06555 [Methanomicrobiales archaeon]|nr:hypothetical protein [Methanomicrobiales archaeon]
MGIPEIDQIKKTEEKAVLLIEATRQRMRLAIDEAKREGEERLSIRLSDAEKRLREERERHEELLNQETKKLLDQAEIEAMQIRQTGNNNKEAAVMRLVSMITGENHVLSRPDE